MQHFESNATIQSLQRSLYGRQNFDKQTSGKACTYKRAHHTHRDTHTSIHTTHTHAETIYEKTSAVYHDNKSHAKYTDHQYQILSVKGHMNSGPLNVFAPNSS